MSELVQTLDTNEGKNPGEAIASYGKSIVFLPAGTPIGKRIRVKLEEITTKKDGRGRTMYKGVPADVEYTERWKDNGDGTASLVTIATDWLFEETQERAVETRKLENREGKPTVVSDLSLYWGNDPGSSCVTSAQIKKIPLEEEKVSDGRLSWVKTGERQEPDTVLTYPITEVKLQNCDFKYRVLESNFDSRWSVVLTVSYRADWGVPSQNFNTTFGAMPEWWRKEVEAHYPVCFCKRQRIDMQIDDGYGKCDICRTEQTCARCGEKSVVKGFQVQGRLICLRCQPWEQQEQLIAKLLSADHKVVIAEEARKLRQGRAFPREEGLAILKATMDHISSNEMDYNRRKILQKWSSVESQDRQWYYFCEDATYGSFYSPAALQLLEFFPQATGNALVEFVAWIACPQFYLSTQIAGRTVDPSLTEEQIKSMLNAVLSDRLRGSETDRIEALSGYRRLVEVLGENSDEARAVAEILQNEKQDYAAAARKIRKIEGKRVPVQSCVAESDQTGRLNLAALRENWGAKVKLR